MYNKQLASLLMAVLLGLILYPIESRGQMFTVDRDRPRRLVPGNQVYIGLEPAKFSFEGDENEVRPGDARYDMNYPILRLRYETGFTELFLGYGDAFTGADSVDFFHVGGRFYRSLILHRTKKFRLLLPLQLQADLTNVTNDKRFAEEFQQSAFLIGAGPGLNLRLAPHFRFTARFVPHIGYSLSPGGTFGGTIFQLDGSSRLYADRIIGDFGLSIGYDYTFKRFNIDVDRFDYNLRSHSILIGITF